MRTWEGCLLHQVFQFQRTIGIIVNPEIYHVTSSNNIYQFGKKPSAFMIVYKCIFDINYVLKIL